MGRPIGTNNIMRTPEEKEQIILEHLTNKITTRAIAEKYGTTQSVFNRWLRKYRQNGIDGLRSKTGKVAKNSGRPKKLNNKEEILNQKIAKLEIEVARLKKGYQVKGVGVKKEYVTTFDVNIK